eukprot:XP_028337074.1 endonuclease 8-like 3 isoform X3 [Physeter catodon]
MVEGPGCTLNGEKIRARVRPGQAVTDMRGRALQSPGGPGSPPAASGPAGSSQAAALNNNKDSSQNFLRLFNGHIYSGVETLGKELFMYFGPKALRIHFGMKGSLVINSVKSKNKNGLSPGFEVQLTKDLICFFDSSVEIRNSAESQQRIRMMEELDVCQLTDEQTHHLVKMVRDFSLLFYRCHKAGSAVSNHYKVYKRPNCGQCCCKITVCRLGENKRMTYFCPHCQKEDPQHVDRCRLPARNTTVSWPSSRGGHLMDSVARKSEEQWTCEVCTLINKPSSKACDACLTSRPTDSVPKNEGNPIVFNSLVKYPCNSFGKPRTEVKINRKTAFGTTTLVLTDFSNESSALEREESQNPIPDGENPNPPTNVCFSDTVHPSKGRTNYRTQLSNKVNTSSVVCSPSKLSSPACKRLKTTHYSSRDLKSGNPGFSNRELRSKTTGAPRSSNAGSPRCSKHDRPCVLQVVRKDGENKGRHFYACPLPREAQCGFFEWADLSFPFCSHGKRSIMRTVLKIGPNNGKNFFVCPLGKEKQCSFFQWAENGSGINIIPGC